MPAEKEITKLIDKEIERVEKLITEKVLNVPINTDAIILPKELEIDKVIKIDGIKIITKKTN